MKKMFSECSNHKILTSGKQTKKIVLTLQQEVSDFFDVRCFFVISTYFSYNSKNTSRFWLVTNILILLYYKIPMKTIQNIQLSTNLKTLVSAVNLN